MNSALEGYRSKLLIPLEDEPIIVHTIKALLQEGSIRRILVLYPRGLIADFEVAQVDPRVTLVEGGNTRQLSVLNGLQILSPLERDGLVLIHDGARCLVSPELLSRCIAACATDDVPVTAAIPMTDSVKEVQGDLVLRSLDRTGLRRVQTPQVFPFPLLVAAHERDSGNATDDASLVEAFSPVKVIEGDEFNLKVTTPFDLEIARLLLRRRQNRAD